MVGTGYEYDTMEEEDPGWRLYFDILYPTEWDMQGIMNRRVIRNLVEGGDDLSKPRGVFHWLYFSKEEDRDRCALALKDNGYKTRSLPNVKPEAKRPLGLGAFRMNHVDEGAINQVSWELFELAQENGGEYDGWETQIVKAGEEPRDDTPDWG